MAAERRQVLSCLLRLGGEKLDPRMGLGGLVWVSRGSVLVCFFTDKIKYRAQESGRTICLASGVSKNLLVLTLIPLSALCPMQKRIPDLRPLSMLRAWL